jgi:hypothetical protein
VDTVVKDFGGVGVVYLLETDMGLYELRSYIASPAAKLCPIRAT